MWSIRALRFAPRSLRLWLNQNPEGETIMGIKYLDDSGPDGTVLGKTGSSPGVTIGESSTAKIGFYGLTTPIARPSVTWPNTATATTTLNELKANRLMAALVALGLIATT
jgi:hypothetical protein